MGISGRPYPQIVIYLHFIDLRIVDHTLIRLNAPPLFPQTV